MLNKKVFIIDEECHGSIGVATSPKSAMRWLIETGWVDEYTDYGIYHYDYAKDGMRGWEHIAIRSYCDQNGIADWKQWLIDNASAEWLEEHFLIYLREVDLAETE